MKYPNCEKECKHRYLQFQLRGADFRCNVTGQKLKQDYIGEPTRKHKDCPYLKVEK
jgi:hypothetical protein